MIILKSDKDIALMAESAVIAKGVLTMIEPYVKPGISTLELNDICHSYMIEHKSIPAPLNYRGFPKSICTSINNVVCHGIPKKEDVLRDGDIVNIDITTIFKGFHADTSRTFLVGNVSTNAKKLVDLTLDCLNLGIAAVKPGARIGDIGAAIQQHAEGNGYSVVRDFVGHGIGRDFHEDPQVLHYGKANTGSRIEPGMVFTIEPMINEGTFKTRVLKDGWTAVTADGKLSAQFEHTIAILSNGDVSILTQ